MRQPWNPEARRALDGDESARSEVESGKCGELDAQWCERAFKARDPRFDGRFFIAVRTTGIYCRPICPVPPPRLKNVRFFKTAAAASSAGFRPCLRCRPESAPGTGAWIGTSATVRRALSLIAEGALDDGDVDGLAARLGIGARHLRRLFVQTLGATPIAVAQTRRLHFAKKLIDETDLPMRDVAFASGFGSVRRFNVVVRETYGRSPSELRQRKRQANVSDRRASLTLLLSYRPPFDWQAVCRYLKARAIRGVERVDGNSYARTVEIGGSRGVLEVSPAPRGHALAVRLGCAEPQHLPAVVARLRQWFDLDAEPAEIGKVLRRHPLTGPRLDALPGVRLIGAWDPFEMAVRAVLGQQVSVRGASTLAGRLVAALGVPFATGIDGLTHAFPPPASFAPRGLETVGMPKSRQRTLLELARAVDDGRVALDRSLGLEANLEQLLSLPGIGDWTAQYIALRALGEPDAFPAADLGLRKAMGEGKELASVARVREVAESWRPWRGYAALLLWQVALPDGGRAASVQKAAGG